MGEHAASVRASAPTGRTSDFWSLYETMLPRIYGYLLYRSNRDIAEDLTQEVFLTAARTFADDANFDMSEAWLFTVARSRLFDHFRARGRSDRNLGLVSSVRRQAETGPAADDAFAARSLDHDTAAALDALSSAQRAALVLHHVDDLSVVDVAERMGRSVRATESLLARARREFRAALEEVRDV